MHLNPDCVRDILLVVESNDFGNFLSFDTLFQKLNGYDREEAVYACLKLQEGDFLNIVSTNDVFPEVVEVREITFTGHEFLNNIRDDGVWKNTKGILSKFSSTSLSIINNVASQIITTLIQAQL